MKTLVLSFAALASAVSLATAGPMMAGSGMAPMDPVPNVDEGFYATVVGGPVWFQEISIGDRINGVRIDADLSFDVGAGLTGSLGYRWSNGFSLEFSGGYFNADTDEIEVDIKSGGDVFEARFDVDADVTVVPLSLNIIYRYPVASPFSFYIGAGAGATYAEIDSTGIESEDSWEFGAQGLAGFTFLVTEQLGINVGYRLLYTDASDEELIGHVAEAGFTLLF